MLLESKIMKYLLVMYNANDGYWENGGRCRWSTDSSFTELEFDLSDEEGLLKAIGHFNFEYPDGELSLYKIEEMTWDESNDIIERADPIIKKLAEEKEKDEKEKARKEKEASAQKAKDRDLEQLRKLQEKYKGEI